MQQMIYETPPRDVHILHEGMYEGFFYRIVSYGAWPCAYVRIPKGHPMYGKGTDALWDFAVLPHGGFTFSGIQKREPGSGWFVGWDYSHAGDYNALVGIDGKRWRTEEMDAECREVIDQIKDMKETQK